MIIKGLILLIPKFASVFTAREKKIRTVIVSSHTRILLSGGSSFFLRFGSRSGLFYRLGSGSGQYHPGSYCTVKKSWPISFSKLLYDMGQDFIDILYVQEVVTHFFKIAYFMKWVTTSSTHTVQNKKKSTPWSLLVHPVDFDLF